MKLGQMVAQYMRNFDTVVLNRPLYRLPTRKAFEEWREAAPAQLCLRREGAALTPFYT